MRDKSLSKDQGGFIFILLALGLMLVIFMVVGLAIDVGRAYVVRGELQNSGDAVSLAGAGMLYPSGAYATPNWEAARATATNFVSNTKADGQPLATADIRYGWWNLAAKSWELGNPVTAGVPLPMPSGYCSISSGPCTTGAACPLPSDVCFLPVPAVEAAIRKTAGVNGGAVPTFFARVVGRNEFSVGSRPAVAISGAPGTVGKNTLFPWTISKCMADRFASSLPSPLVRITLYINEPDPCSAGQWTSFKDDTNSVPPIRDMLTIGNNPVPFALNDQIHIVPGDNTSLFKDVPVGRDVLLPVVADNNPSGHPDVPLLGYAAFHIDAAVGGSGKYIEGRFINYDGPLPLNSSPGGPAYGIYSQPALVH